MTGSTIARRLVDELGVDFAKGVPTRAQSRRHGQLVDTFLVMEHVRRGRTVLDEKVPWRWNGLSGVSVVLHDTPRNLAKARIAVELDAVAGHAVLAVYDAEARAARDAARVKTPLEFEEFDDFDDDLAEEEDP